jgi:zinc transporter ZupT
MDNKDISENLERLNDLLERRSRKWNTFLTGVISGIGTAIGAALIGAIIVGLVASNLSKIPIIKDILPDNVLNQYIVEDE